MSTSGPTGDRAPAAAPGEAAEAQPGVSRTQLLRLQEALAELTRPEILAPQDTQSALVSLTEAAVRCSDVDRAAVWLFAENGSAVVCADRCERGVAEHQRGMRLRVDDFAEFFAAIRRGETVVADDVDLNGLTRRLAEACLRDDAVAAMLSIPLRVGDEVLGALCLHRLGTPTVWQPEQRLFGQALANLFALVVERSRRERAEQALRLVEQRLREIGAQSGTVIWIADPGANQVLYISPSYREQTGEDESVLYADPLSWRRLVVAEDRRRLRAFLAAQQERRVATAEVRVRHPDGSIRWIWLRSFPWRNEDGRGLVVGTVDDITARKQVETQRLERVASQRDALVREVHHRIKNNLQGVTGILRRFASRHAELRAPLAQAISHVQTIAMIHGLFGRPGFVRIAVCELVPAIAAAVESTLGDSEVHLDVRIERRTAAILVPAEAVPVGLVLNELLLNAAKHSAGDGRREVGVCVSGDGDAVTVEIRNPGTLPAGFAPDCGRGAGDGLRLVTLLLPKPGATLAVEQIGEFVVARLELAPPATQHRAGA